MIMEDCCELALTIRATDAERRSEDLRQLEAAADRITKLLQGARVLDALNDC